MSEIWKPVVGHDGYEVSNLGRVRSLDRVWPQLGRGGKAYTHRKPGRLLRPGISSSGYPTVALGRGNTRTVHSLVAHAFTGPCPEGEEVRHRNGVRTDPRACNLHYGTRLQNIQDAREHGTWREAWRRAHAKTLVLYRWGYK